MNANRHKLTKVGSVLLLALAMTVASAWNAEAAFRLTIDDPAIAGIEVDITDDGDGFITFSGLVAPTSVWNVISLDAFSKPALPASSVLASMDLAGVIRSSSSAPLNNLVILLTDNGFPAMTKPGSLIGNFGGTTSGAVGFSGYKNNSDAEFDVVNAEAQVHGVFADPPGPPPTGFGGSASDIHGPIGSYSMTMFVGITHPAGVFPPGISTTFGFSLANIPEPASLTLFGLGLAGFGIASRRRRRKALADEVSLVR
jgi:hypothetical protein